ncbi:MAG TPA: hypothetical protein VGX75_15970 [bacterium]|nr:hypothetical protein [bacterium]
MRGWGSAALVVCFVALVTLPSSGAMMGMDLVGSIKTQLKTASFHAGELAQKANAIGAVKLHSQHTINCLEGPTGAHFVQAVGYPCQGQGHGILPDLKAAVAAKVPGAQDAWDDANIALNLLLQARDMSDIMQAQPWDKVVAEYLAKASSDLGP